MFGWSIQRLEPLRGYRRGWCPQGVSTTGGGGSARIPNLRVCQYPCSGVAHARERMPNYRPAVVPSGRRVSTSSETQGGKTRMPARVNGRHVVRGRQSSLILECAQVTGKAGENGQNSGNRAATHPGRDRRLPGVVTHSRL